jgi:hypothetical protein
MPIQPSRRKFVQDAGLASIALSLSPQFIKAQSNSIKAKKQHSSCQKLYLKLLPLV